MSTISLSASTPRPSVDELVLRAREIGTWVRERAERTEADRRVSFRNDCPNARRRSFPDYAACRVWRLRIWLRGANSRRRPRRGRLLLFRLGFQLGHRS